MRLSLIALMIFGMGCTTTSMPQSVANVGYTPMSVQGPDGGTWDPTADFGCGSSGGIKYYVDTAASSGGDGSLSAPFQTIQEGVSAVASGEVAVVCIAEGTYSEHVASAADVFTSGREWTLVGGFVSGFASRDASLYTTTLSAPNKNAPALQWGNVKSWTVDGLSITNGKKGIAVVGGYSAGRFATVSGCRIYANGVDGESMAQGAGMLLSAGTILVESSVIEDNTGGRMGGGFYITSAPSSESNTKSGGVLTLGTALATIKNNTVRNNTLRHDTPHGVGMAISMNALVEDNIVTGNVGYKTTGGGEAVGGGVFVQNQYVTATIAGNWIVNNTAKKAAAGIFIDEAAIGTIINNVVAKNTSNSPYAAIAVDGRGSGSAAEDRGYGTIVNNTIVSNPGGGIVAQDSTVVAVNNVLSGNGNYDFLAAGGGSLSQSITANYNRYSTVGGGTSGTNNTTSAVTFVDAANEDWHLTAGSVGVNAGTSSVTPAFSYTGSPTLPPGDDFDDVSRPQGSAIDMGAFER